MFPPSYPTKFTKEQWADEYETAKYWDRPVKGNPLDTPFYPWAPPACRVSFKLGFQ